MKTLELDLEQLKNDVTDAEEDINCIRKGRYTTLKENEYQHALIKAVLRELMQSLQKGTFDKDFVKLMEGLPKETLLYQDKNEKDSDKKEQKDRKILISSNKNEVSDKNETM